VHALVRLRDTFSPPPATPPVRADFQPASCSPPPACAAVRPFITAADATIIPFRRPAAAAHAISRRFIPPQQSNAAHHPPRNPAKGLNNLRVRGRVHALVRLRPALARATLPGQPGATRDPRHASRLRPAPRSGRTSRPPPLRSDHFATRRTHAFNMKGR
jgi:hypothetical protein